MRIAFKFALPVMLLCISSFASRAQDQDTAVIDKFIARQAAEESADEYKEARKVATGDLNRDGVPDLVVLYTIEGQNGTNNYTQYLAAFVRMKGKLVHVTHTSVGGKLNRDVELQSIRNNVVLFKTLNYGPRDAACCPSKKGTARFTLVGRKLKEL